MQKKSLNEIIVHVGLHKTATTSIQISLSDKRNERLLNKNNFLYPNSWPINHSIPVYSAFCDKPEMYRFNIDQKLTREQVDELNKSYINDIKKEVFAKSPEKLIISGEDISMLDVHRLRDFRNFLVATFNPSRIRVIVYVRDPLSLSISKIQEDIKSGVHTIESASSINLDIKAHSIKKRLIDIEEVFNKESMEVYTFEDAVKASNGPVGHFLSLIGFDQSKDIAKFHIERSNEGLSLLAANIISFVNDKYILFKNGVINPPRENEDTIPLTKLLGEKFNLTCAMKKKILHNYKDEIYWLKDYWKIDYNATIEEKDDRKKLIISSEQLSQLKGIHTASSKTIQDLIVEFLNGVVKEDVDVPFGELDSLISMLVKVSEDDTSKKLSEERFRHVLGIDTAIDPAEVYREIALFLESYDNVDTALVFMNKAADLRPEGPFIQEKIKEYLLKK
jgi:hypothetical protein